MALTDKLEAEKAGLESYLDSERGAKLEQNQIDRLDTINSLLGIGSGEGGSSDASAANQLDQITEAELTNSRIGELTESAPANDTASSGLNGRLQRIAQRLTSLMAIFPSSLGIKTAANSLSVVPASDAVFTVTQTTPTSFYEFTATITRAANTTAYTANDVYGAAFQLVGNTTPPSGIALLITDIDVIFNIATLPSGMAAFTFYPYSITPPSAIADNDAFSVSSGDRASILYPKGISIGSASLAQGGGSLVAQANLINSTIKLTGTSLFGYLVTTGAFTPAANSQTATIRVRAIAV